MIPIQAKRDRELRVRLQGKSWSNFDVALFRNPDAPSANATVTLSRDGAVALIHALDAALEEADNRRERWLKTPQGEAWEAEQGMSQDGEVGPIQFR